MVPRRSPSRCCPLKPTLARTSSDVPRMAMIIPARKRPVMCSPKRSQAIRVTKTGARLARRVALATEVEFMDQCQKARSPAKNRPAAAAQNTLRPGRVSVPPVFGAIGDGFLSFPKPEKFRCAPMAFQARKKGRARNTRWKAVAVGGNSLRRTRIGEKAMHKAPIMRAEKAHRLSECPSACMWRDVLSAVEFSMDEW